MESTYSDTKMQANQKPATSKALEPAMSDKIVEKAEWLKDETVEAYDSSIQVIRKNPVTSVAVATGVGIIIGMFFKNRH